MTATPVILVLLLTIKIVLGYPLNKHMQLNGTLSNYYSVEKKRECFENNNVSRGDQNWHFIPDKNGYMYLADISATNDTGDSSFNAWRDVRFVLFTRQNRNASQQIELHNTDQLEKSHFDPAHRTRFIIHGWYGDNTSPMNNAITDAYLTIGKFNVFVIDWGMGAVTLNYATARKRVSNVGLVIAEFIDFLHSKGLPFSSVSLIGHSLGAHVAGFAGKNVLRGKIASIVGLDPAAPLFSYAETHQRLHKRDAYYVQTIHTEINRLGFDYPIGHSSFYPNWGRSQPGCGWNIGYMCSHSRAYEFFAESIFNANAFWSTRCSGPSDILNQVCKPVGADGKMGGEPVDCTANGIYYLTTNENSPFGQGQLP